MKTLKNSKIVLLLLVIGIFVGCKKENQIKSTITPTSVVYEDTSLNSYVTIDSTTFIGAYGAERKDTFRILFEYMKDTYLEDKTGSPLYTDVKKLFSIHWDGKSSTGKKEEDTLITISFVCNYSDTNSLEKYGRYLPVVGNYLTYYHCTRFRHHELYDGLTITVKWGDESCDFARYSFGNKDYTNSTISSLKLSDGKYHLVLNIEPLLLIDGCNYFDINNGPYSNFKARIVLN